jgi:hypothetical protein
MCVSGGEVVGVTFKEKARIFTRVHMLLIL